MITRMHVHTHIMSGKTVHSNSVHKYN